MAKFDPNRSFKSAVVNVSYWIAKRSLPTKRSLCAAVDGVIVGFSLCKRAWDRMLHLVAW